MSKRKQEDLIERGMSFKTLKEQNTIGDLKKLDAQFRKKIKRLSKGG